MVPEERGWIGLRSIVCFVALAAAGSAIAQQQQQNDSRVTTLDHAVEFYISDDALQAQYVRNVDLGEVGPTEIRGGFFYNEDRDLIAIGDLLMHVGDEVDLDSAFDLRVGTRVYGAFLAPEDQDVFGIGLGGEVQYFMGSDRASSITLGLFYSPDIATFGQADNVKDVSVRFTTRLRGGTDIFLGFRMFEIDIEPQDREVDDNLHVGIRRVF